MADPTPYIDYSQGPYADQGVQQFLQTMLPKWNQQWEDPTMQGGYVDPSGGAVTLGGVKGLTDKALQDFTQQVQAVTGQAPTADQINQFFTSQMTPAASQAQPGGYNPINPQDITSMIQQYVPTAFAPQIQQYQQGQQTQALNQNMNTGENMINQAMSGFANNLTNPNNPMYQNFSGNMNNMGITPQSGAFQAGLGGTIANQENQMQQALMSTLGAPTLAGIQGLSGQANANLQGAAPTAQANLTGQQNQLSDFGREQAIAQYLQNQMQPSALQKDIGMAAGAGQAVGGLGQGLAGAHQLTWICTAMRKHGVITQSEIAQLHKHLFMARWKMPLKFLGYLLFGKLLVWRAESKGVDWRIWKPLFYDEPMRESDPIEAVKLYESAFWNLYQVVCQREEQWHSIIR
jgi:hypothetical protein